MATLNKIFSLPLTDNGKKSMAIATLRLLTDQPVSQKMHTIWKECAKFNESAGYWDFTDIVGKLANVNKMVKTSSCPNNFKNKFYEMKGKVIKKMYEENMFEKVYDEGKYYCFVPKGHNSIGFHQRKERCAYAKATSTRDCTVTPPDESYIFDKRKYGEFLLTAIYFLNRIN